MFTNICECYYVPNTILSILSDSCDFILPGVLWSGYYKHHLILKRKSGFKRFTNLLKAIPLTIEIQGQDSNPGNVTKSSGT